MKKLIAIAIVIASAQASAWWGDGWGNRGWNNNYNNGYGWGNGYGNSVMDGAGDASGGGDFSMNFSGRGNTNMRGYGSGYGYGDGYGRGYNYSAPYYGGYGSLRLCTSLRLRPVRRTAGCTGSPGGRSRRSVIRHTVGLPTALAVTKTPQPAAGFFWGISPTKRGFICWVMLLHAITDGGHPCTLP